MATVFRICSGVCLELMKNRTRAASVLYYIMQFVAYNAGVAFAYTGYAITQVTAGDTRSG